jgi:hypothetical protein
VLDVFFGTDVLLPRFGISGLQTLQDGDGTFPLLRRRLSFDSGGCKNGTHGGDDDCFHWLITQAIPRGCLNGVFHKLDQLQAEQV